MKTWNTKRCQKCNKENHGQIGTLKNYNDFLLKVIP